VINFIQIPFVNERRFVTAVLVSLERGSAMRIYVFKSETTERLRAFASDPDVHKLPHQHSPWTATGAIASGRAPPHKFSREAIEKGIDANGFQLWHLRDKAEAPD
jgi:hypothetical protein